MATSTITKNTLSRTIFLAKLLILGEDFFERRGYRRSMQHLATVERANHETGTRDNSQHDNRVEKGAYRLLALKLCLETMQNLRGPSATRLLEMEINQLEGDIFSLLHRIEICPDGLKIVRSSAQQLLNNKVFLFDYFLD
jgi:hypothetical protein